MFSLGNPGADGLYNLIAVSAGVVWVLGVILSKSFAGKRILGFAELQFLANAAWFDFHGGALGGFPAAPSPLDNEFRVCVAS
jgi:hypothetical protein